jgi:multidrug resistance efflux pump
MAEQQATGAPTAQDGSRNGRSGDAGTNGHRAGENGVSPDGNGSGAPTATLTADPPTDDASAAETPTKRRRIPKRRNLVIMGVVLLLIVAAGAGAYFVNASQYVTTDNAQVDGDQLQINAPATGTLTDWRASQGDQIRDNMAVGRIELPGSGARVQQIIRAPGAGTVAVDNAVEGQWVTAGERLATAYNGDGIYATARVDETDIQDVHVGSVVDIDVDAYSSTPVTGVVSEIQDAAAAQFSLFPESNSSGNFQKVTQVIPVKIMFTNTGDLPLVPGMNITVHIHKHG